MDLTVIKGIYVKPFVKIKTIYSYQLRVRMLPFPLVNIQYCMGTSLGTT